jgi:ssDNA-binding Zn-finger/Zn-ribbon topoisomerase 1
MDFDNLVDNEPSINLNIKIGKKEGVIKLSSIYGSYNYICDIDIAENETADFICPHCKELINSKVKCKVCNASMVPFFLEMGGKVCVCSRAGCKNHLVEFEDLSNALRMFYQEYGFISKQSEENYSDDNKSDEIPVYSEEDEVKEILETGTFLQAYCPSCWKSLIESDMLKLKIVSDNNEVGYVMLSPYLNVFSSKSTIFLAEGKPVGDFRCFHCEHTLMSEDKVCEVCSSPVARISISARSKLIDFYICSKKGCRWHGLSEDDISDIKLEDSLEW